MMDTKDKLIQIKGLRDGLLVTLGEGDWAYLEELLFFQIDGRSAFFRGARLALDVGDQELRVSQISKLRDALSEREVSLWAVVSKSPKTVQTAQLLGLATRVSKQRPAQVTRPIVRQESDAGKSALWLPRTIRSGTRIEHSGHVVVFGDVNPGAEIIAEGSVLVWGRLRGFVHAGAALRTGSGPNSSAFVCALTMKPTRLQIGSETMPLSQAEQSESPQKISLKNGNFRKEIWQGGNR
jgi:septum site-determining protein MinC